MIEAPNIRIWLRCLLASAYSAETGQPFQRKLDTDPPQTGRLFQAKLDSRSEATHGWMLFTRCGSPPSISVELFAGTAPRGPGIEEPVVVAPQASQRAVWSARRSVVNG